MFSAFGSIDYPSNRARTPTEAAVKRLDGIGYVLSGLDLSAIRTQDDLTRALWSLETAEKCIRAIRAEFRTEVASEQLVQKAEDLIDLIEQARDELIGCRAARS